MSELNNTNPIRLQFDAVSAEVLPQRGGCLKSLLIKGREIFFWDKNPTAQDQWHHGGMPLLFPFAGRNYVNNQVDRYIWNETIYTLPIHGFLWSLPWKVESQTPSTCKLSVRANEHTLRWFPFHFEINADFQLSTDGIRMEFAIKNCDSRLSMPLAFGIHPYFAADESSKARLPKGQWTSVSTQGLTGEPQLPPAQPTPVNEERMANSILHLPPQSDSQFAIDSNRQTLHVAWEGTLPIRCIVTYHDRSGRFICIEPWQHAPGISRSGAEQDIIPPQSTLDLRVTMRLSDLE